MGSHEAHVCRSRNWAFWVQNERSVKATITGQVPEVGRQLRRQRFQNSSELLEVPSTELGLSAGRPYPSSCPSLVRTSEWATNRLLASEWHSIKMPGIRTVHLRTLTLFWGARAKVGEKKNPLVETEKDPPKGGLDTEDLFFKDRVGHFTPLG